MKVTKKVPANHWDNLKYAFDGINTFGDLAIHMRALADSFEALARLDAKMLHSIDNSHIDYIIPGHDAEVETCDCTEHDEDEECFEFDDDYLDAECTICSKE